MSGATLLQAAALAVCAGCAVAGSLPAAASSPPPSALLRQQRLRPLLDATYGWPLRPFDRQHPIRGGFGDPRFGARGGRFHVGVDISAPGGTPVYAVAPGVAYRESDRIDVLSVFDPMHGLEDGFAYWHVVPVVREGAHVRVGELIGRVNGLWKHVHLGQLVDDVWVNPLRADGGLRPYVDRTRPTIVFVRVVVEGRPVRAFAAGTAAGLAVSAYDVPPPPLPPPPYDGARLAPALMRWRIARAGRPLPRWRTAADFRAVLSPRSRFATVYAPGTQENLPGEPGTYVFRLAGPAVTARLVPGRYALDVEAFTIRGRRADAAIAFTVLPGESRARGAQ